LQGYRIPFFEDEEYEADDILATLARKAEKAGLDVEIFTGDKDILQILSPSIKVVRFKKGISQKDVFDPQKVKEEFGVTPEQIPDYLALVGDTSDNIPGVPGIGPVTAVKLIQQYGSLEKILDNLEKLPPKIAGKIRENTKKAKLSKRLSTVICQVPVELNLEKLKVKAPDKEKLLDIFKKLEFKELIEKLGLSDCQSSEKLPGSKEIEKTNHKIEVKLRQEPLFLWWENEGNRRRLFISSSRGKSFVFSLDEDSFDKVTFSQLKNLLESGKYLKIGHDLKNLLVKLKILGIGINSIKFDTAVAAYLINPSSGNYSLENLSRYYLEENISSTGENGSIKIKFIKKLYPALETQLQDKGMKKLFYEIELPLIEVLAEMELRGIKVDPTVLKSLCQQIRKMRKKTEEEIYTEVGERFNLNSPQQLGKILFEKLNLPLIKKSKTGYSTSERTLQTLSPLCETLNKILDYRHLFKLETSYIQPLSSMINPSTGRIHTCFNQLGTNTGRLSSSNPNLQNIPVRGHLGDLIRKAFIAEEGCLFISADYSQIELRILAHLSGDSNLISAFLQGEDIHRETAVEIFNCLPLQVNSRMRRIAKMVNFGIIYGISPFGLARDLGISEKEAQEYIERYFSRYSGVKRYIEKTLEQAHKKGYVTTLLGRRRYLPEINSKNKRRRKFAERMAINSPIQGSAADLIKIAMLNIYRRLKEENLPAWLILQIHDELILEVTENQINRVRKIVKEEMENALKLSVPLVVDTKVGKNWAEISH
ncbi:MAG: DNA polymerase I, partial [Candidatus Aenigmatarchaeota archaeon]